MGRRWELGRPQIILSPFRLVCPCVDEYQHYVELFLNGICLNKNCFIGALLTKERDNDEQRSSWMFLQAVCSCTLAYEPAYLACVESLHLSDSVQS